MEILKKFLTVAALTASFVAWGEEVALVDVTSKVGTTVQDWHGTNTYNLKVFTATGAEVNMVERYYDGDHSTSVDAKPLYQTISGLEDGNYQVKLYATAFNAWMGDAGLTGPSDEVAVLYATSGETTVTTPIHADKQPNYSVPGEYSLKIAVTNGELELGQLIKAANKCEWYCIQIRSLELEVDASEALDAIRANAQSTLDDEKYANIVGEERTNLANAIANATTAEEINTALQAFTAAAPFYDAWAAAKANVEADNYKDATAAKIDALTSLLTETPANAEAAKALTPKIVVAYRAAIESNVILEGVEGSHNLTSLIANPDAADGIAGWTLSLSEGDASIGIRDDECPTLADGTTPAYFDGGNWGGVVWASKFEQTVAAEGEGTYRLAVLARCATEIKEYKLGAKVGDGEEKTIEMPKSGSSSDVQFGRGWIYSFIDFEVPANADITMSVYASSELEHLWQSFTCFRLSYVPKDDSGVEDVTIDANSYEKVIYDLYGRRIDNPGTGIYIVNGKKTFIRK